MKLWLSVSLPLYVLDQITKALVLAKISTDEIVPVIPGFFNLVQVHNTGAAFGMLRDNNLFFIVLSCAALIILGILGWKEVFPTASRAGRPPCWWQEFAAISPIASSTVTLSIFSISSCPCMGDGLRLMWLTPVSVPRQDSSFWLPFSIRSRKKLNHYCLDDLSTQPT